MELNLKKTTLALFALGISGVASAAMYTPAPAGCTSHPVTVPCERTGWDLGIEGFYDRASNDDLRFSEELRTLNSTPTVIERNKEPVAPGYHFGFRLEGSYHFSTGNDVTMNWTRYHHSDTDHIIGNSLIGRNLATPTTGYDNVRGSARFDLDIINAEFGQHVDLGPNMDLRLHAGFQYASLDHTFSVKGWNNAVADNYNTFDVNSDFHGFGIRGGFDSAYNLGNGFLFTTHGWGALLVGTMRTNTYARTFNGAGVLQTESSEVLHERTVIPAAGMKAGVAYKNNGFTLEAGWRVLAYFNIVKHYPNDSSTASSFASNFGLNGPYLGLKYVA